METFQKSNWLVQRFGRDFTPIMTRLAPHRMMLVARLHGAIPPSVLCRIRFARNDWDAIETLFLQLWREDKALHEAMDGVLEELDEIENGQRTDLAASYAAEDAMSPIAGRLAAPSNRPEPLGRGDASAIPQGDVLGKEFITTHFRDPSALTEALCTAMHHVLKSNIMHMLPRATEGAVRARADSDPYETAEKIAFRVAAPHQLELQRRVLTFVRQRKRLHRYLASPPRQIRWQLAPDKADSRLRKSLQEELNPAEFPLHSDVLAGCLAGTRTQVLDDVEGAVKDAVRAGGKQVVWLGGVVGAGKTSVMSSMAERLAKFYHVATFYCSRTRAAQSHARRVFPTIGYSLGLSNADIGVSIRDVTRRRAEPVTTPADQLQVFILDPLKEAAVGPTVIIIDALDECGTDDDLRQLLNAIASKAGDVSGVVLLVSSRPEQAISRKLSQSFRILDLGDDKYRTSARDDVSRYINYRLSGDSDFRNHTLPKVRPTIKYSDAVHRLAKLANGYFVVASFTCSVILGPVGRAQFLENTLSLGKIDSHTPPLYQQYRTALGAIFAQWCWKDGQVKRDVDKILGILCCVSESLPSSTIARLGQIRDDIVDDILKALSPLLSVSSDSYMFFHASVPEFLSSQSAGGHRIDTRAEHGNLFSSCLGILASQLHFNMFDIVDRTVELDQLKAEALLPPEVRYASIFWTQHLAASSLSPEMAGAEIAILLESKLLFWLEVLSGLGRVFSDGIGGLDRVSAFLGTNASKTVADCQRCLNQWSSDISSHPCRIYLLVLPWLPRLFREQLRAHNPWILDASPRARMGAPSRWPDELSIWKLGSGVCSVAWSPDGRLIAAGKEDGTVEIRNSQTGEQHGRVLQGHSHSVHSVVFSPDSSLIASGSDDHTVRLWDVSSRAADRCLKGHANRVKSVAFSTDGSRLASGSDDKTIRLWNVQTGAAHDEPLQERSAGVISVAFSPDDSTIASGLGDGTIRLWDVMGGAPYGKPFKGHTDGVQSVAFSPDGSKIASGSDDKTIQFWDVHSRVPCVKLLGGHTKRIRSIAFSPDGLRIASSSDDSTIQRWNVHSGKLHGEPLRGHTGCVHSITFSPDGSKIVSGSTDATVRLWDAHSRAPGSEPIDGQCHTGPVGSVALSPDGSMIVSGSADKTIHLWNANSEPPCCKVFEGHSGDVNSVAFSSDGLTIASGSDDRTVRLWDVLSGAPCRKPLQEHANTVCSVAFSSDNSIIASGSNDSTVRLWDAHSGMPCGGPLAGHTGSVCSVAFSPDCSKMASGSMDSTLRLWDTTSGVPCGEPLEGHNHCVSSVTFSPDGSILASGSYNKTVRLWSVKTGATLCDPLKGHTCWVVSVVFSKDGALLFSLSDSEMLVWDLGTRTQILHVADPSTLKSSEQLQLGLPSGYIPMVFSPASRTLAGRFGNDENQIFALSVPSNNPWGALCDAHARLRWKPTLQQSL